MKSKLKESKLLKSILIIIVVILVLFIGYVGYGVTKFTSSCAHDKKILKQNSDSLASNLRQITVGNSKPQIVNEATTEDCVDSGGTDGRAVSYYQVGGLPFNTINSQAIAAVGGSESDISTQVDTNFWGYNPSSNKINYLQTSITTSDGKTYNLSFGLATPYACPSYCDDSNVITQYGLSSTPIKTLYIEQTGS